MNKEVKDKIISFFEKADLAGHEPVSIPAGKITDLPFFVKIQLARANGKASKESEAAIDRLIELRKALELNYPKNTAPTQWGS
jgi:hypothetical protein